MSSATETTQDQAHPVLVTKTNAGAASRWAAAGLCAYPAMLTFLYLAGFLRSLPNPESLPLDIGIASALLFGVFALIRSGQSASPSPTDPAEARILDGALEVRPRIGRGFRVEREAVVDGLLSGAKLEVELRGGDFLTIDFVEPRRARAAMDALGAGAAQQRLTTETTGPWRRAIAGLLGLAVAFLGMYASTDLLFTALGHATLWPALWPLPLTALLVFLLRPKRITIGTDGVIVHDLFGRRFIPHEDITEVSASGGRLLLTLKDGAVCAVDSAQAAALADRVREASALTHGGDVSLQALARGERTVEDWIGDLRGILKSASDYRRASLDRTRLLDVLVDGEATNEERVAAAVALRLAGDDSAREPIRVASAAFADPKTREKVLELANAELEDEAVAEALRAVSRSSTER
ncbi:MAG: PH domain-containing protein [Polyangiaceae bacterium]